MRDDQVREEIAIVGMAGRFPGARNVAEFWANIRDGVSSIRAFAPDELRASGVDEATLGEPSFVNAGAVLDEPDGFDAAFFGISPREAQVMDPQHRALLECAWAALEDAGYDPMGGAGLVGVFAGVAANTYFQSNLVSRPELLEMVGHYPAMIASEREYAVTRIAHRLDLKGPAVSVNTACSTSGVAIHLACQSVLSGECDMALAGGARIKVPLRAGYVYQEDGILSPDGACRAFDADARGTVVGSGVAMVVLKRLSDALRDGDTIRAIIKGTAINNDGALKAGFTAPSVQGQAAVVSEALAMADVSPDSITYVEAHGTGTSLGDPIEVAALSQAFRQHTRRTGFCGLGSVKTNIGHLDAAAGVAGVIKTVLALEHARLPPSLHFRKPNPEIDFALSPFYVNVQLAEWPGSDRPKRAGVSSFGLGGTNAHIVLEEAPKTGRDQANEASAPTRPSQLLVVSAKSQTAMEAATQQLGDRLAAHPEFALDDVAYTLQVGRHHFAHRRAVVASEVEGAVSALRTGGGTPAGPVESDASIVFMFPGGGAQYTGMGAELYRTEPAFAGVVDRCAELLQPSLGMDIRQTLYPDDAATRLPFEDPLLALPALFAVECALAELWKAWGVAPDALIGHSLGEYAAACVAGSLPLEDALALVVRRAQLFQKLPRGGMVGVPLSEGEVRDLLADDLSLAAVNSPTQCVVSGPLEAIARVEGELGRRGIDFTRLHIAVAAHSHLVDSILGDFRAFVRTVSLRPPERAWVSNVTGTWITDDQAVNPDYWVEHLRGTVRFSEGLSGILQDGRRLLVEVGPGQTLGMLSRQHPSPDGGHVTTSSLPHPKDPTPDAPFFLESVGRAWCAGAKVDWARAQGGRRRRRIPLPTYPFERKRYWADAAPTIRDVRPQEVGHGAVTGVLGVGKPPETRPAAAEPEEQAAVHAAIGRQDRIAAELVAILAELSGMGAEEIDRQASFLELGFDSLFLTQANTAFRKRFGVALTFRQLFEEAPTVEALARYLDGKLPQDAFQDESAAEKPVQHVPAPTTPARDLADVVEQSTTPQSVSGADPGVVERVVAKQLALMEQQLALLRGQMSGAAPATEVEAPRESPAIPAQRDDATQRGAEGAAPAAREAGFGPWRPIERATQPGLTARQQKHLDGLIARFANRTKESKRLTQLHRGRLSDPRTAAGFQRAWKEIVYPIVSTRASGSKLWDVDGNEWLDITMGFGVTLFGHSPPFVVRAIQEQLGKSLAIGPQTELAGKVAGLVCELTGMERAAFCNTGSEAVLAAIRIARTVTGRDRIAVFANAYHGIFDEVIVRGGRGGRSAPAAPGIPRKTVEDVLVLEYGDDGSLDVIRANAGDLAAVLVEPVQSRQPDLQPREFLHSLRALTAELDIPLVFDEMITGFRVHPGGAQAWFGVQADIATYGKVVGGGMPIGVVAGKARYLDALDGGMWSYGDESVPEAGVTWFAGTFVRHPLALAAAHAALVHLREEGPALQAAISAKTEQFASDLNRYFADESLPIHVVHFASLFAIQVGGDREFAGLFWHHLRDKGIHCHEGRPNFLTSAHTDQDMAVLRRAFIEAAREMREGGFFADASAPGAEHAAIVRSADAPPITEEQQELWLAWPRRLVWVQPLLFGDPARRFARRCAAPGAATGRGPARGVTDDVLGRRHDPSIRAPPRFGRPTPRPHGAGRRCTAR
jgi:acyl transferase domain-containing protein